MTNSTYTVILPAAGLGVRMGAGKPKALLSIDTMGGESILGRTVSTFVRDPACRMIVVCVTPGEESHFTEILSAYSSLDTEMRAVAGGATRQDSVRIGLNAALNFGAQENDKVLVHDAARCCVTQSVINRVVDELDRVAAVSAAVPVVDSVARATEAKVDSYIDRSGLWSIQTPQGFRLKAISDAHEHAARDGIPALDDASIAKHVGMEVRLVLGDRLNIKVTTPEDLDLAQRIFESGTVSGGIRNEA